MYHSIVSTVLLLKIPRIQSGKEGVEAHQRLMFLFLFHFHNKVIWLSEFDPWMYKYVSKIS